MHHRLSVHRSTSFEELLSKRAAGGANKYLNNTCQIVLLHSGSKLRSICLLGDIFAFSTCLPDGFDQSWPTSAERGPNSGKHCQTWPTLGHLQTDFAPNLGQLGPKSNDLSNLAGLSRTLHNFSQASHRFAELAPSSASIGRSS